VHAWVLMTNHAHLIISTEGDKMEHILRDMKSLHQSHSERLREME